MARWETADAHFRPIAIIGRMTHQSMMRRPILGATAVAAMLTLTGGCAHDLDMRTNDLVVFGHVKTLAYAPVDELGMNGQFTARLTITRVLSGRAPSSVITIKYIAHTDLASDQEIRFHLRRSTEGIWLACSDGEGKRGYICR